MFIKLISISVLHRFSPIFWTLLSFKRDQIELAVPNEAGTLIGRRSLI